MVQGSFLERLLELPKQGNLHHLPMWLFELQNDFTISDVAGECCTCRESQFFTYGQRDHHLAFA
jgi:hypothetical protein